MIKHYINELIQNLPKQNKPLEIDLVLDGGIFNGNYLIGCMYFLKELENINYVKIKRISGCSVGSAVGLLYALDKLDVAEKLNTLISNQLRQNYNIPVIKDLKTIVFDKKEITEQKSKQILKKVNNYLYISFYKKHNRSLFFNKITKKKYNSINNLVDSILKSCYVPYFIDGSLLYKNKYIDGISPYIFNIRTNRKILYLNLCHSDKLTHMINIKNEKSNIHRVLTGLLDIHLFFIKESTTSICSYINNWTLLYKCQTQYVKYIFEYIVLFILTVTVNIQQTYFANSNSNSNSNSKEVSTFIQATKDLLFFIYKAILKKYFI